MLGNYMEVKDNSNIFLYLAAIIASLKLALKHDTKN